MISDSQKNHSFELIHLDDSIEPIRKARITQMCMEMIDIIINIGNITEMFRQKLLEFFYDNVFFKIFLSCNVYCRYKRSNNEHSNRCNFNGLIGLNF